MCPREQAAALVDALVAEGIVFEGLVAISDGGLGPPSRRRHFSGYETKVATSDNSIRGIVGRGAPGSAYPIDMPQAKTKVLGGSVTCATVRWYSAQAIWGHESTSSERRSNITD
jgi:hypothetical protein